MREQNIVMYLRLEVRAEISISGWREGSEDSIRGWMEGVEVGSEAGGREQRI